jgi:hypothetical protein
MATTKKLSMGVCLSAFSCLATLSIATARANAAVINFASVSEGASIINSSSQHSYAELPQFLQPINGGVETSRNNLLSTTLLAVCAFGRLLLKRKQQKKVLNSVATD